MHRQDDGEDPEAILSRNGWPFGLRPVHLAAPTVGVGDAVLLCGLAEGIAELDGCLDAGTLLLSAGGDPTECVRRMHERHAVAFNRPADRRKTIRGISACVGSAVRDCQVALGVSRIPYRPNMGAYVIWREPCFTKALYGGRTLEEIAAIVATNELRSGAKRVSWLRKEPWATDPVEDCDFWLAWPGNGPRLLKACRDLVTRRIAWKGGGDTGGLAAFQG